MCLLGLKVCCTDMSVVLVLLCLLCWRVHCGGGSVVLARVSRGLCLLCWQESIVLLCSFWCVFVLLCLLCWCDYCTGMLACVRWVVGLLCCAVSVESCL
jgi:hypothetical protein